MSRMLTSPDGGNTVTRKIPILNGGSDQVTPPLALAAFDGIPASQYNIANGVAGLNNLGVLPFTSLPDSLGSSVALTGPTLLFPSTQGKWTITNYDSTISYTISCTAGFISRSGDTLYYTAPSTAGTYQISINDKTIDIVVDDVYIDKPSITAPIQDAIMRDSGYVVKSSNISVLGAIQKKALRFKGVNSYLSRTPAVAGNLLTFTWSGWVKRSKIGTHQVLVGAGTSTVSSPYETTVKFKDTNIISVTWNGASGGVGDRFESAVTFTDINTWHHIVIRFDMSNAIRNNRVLVWVDNVAIPLTAVGGSSGNAAGAWNSTTPHYLGIGFTGNTEYLNGYVSEVNFIDGQALDPSYFGQTDPDTNQWLPKTYTGTYGTNGFYLDFSSPTTLTQDKSGNNNHWTPNNIGYTYDYNYDNVLDNPVTNYAVLDPSASTLYGQTTIQNGGLTINQPNPSSNYGTTIVKASQAANAANNFWEVTLGSAPGASTSADYGIGIIIDANNFLVYYIRTGQVKVNVAGTLSLLTTIAACTLNDVVGVYINTNDSTINFYKNGTLLYKGSNPLAASTYYPGSHIDTGFNDGRSIIFHYNFGQQSFAYSITSSYKTLFTPDPHKNTDWQLSDNPSFSTVTSELLASTTNKQSWSISGLALDTDYYLRCRYRGVRYGASEWSDIRHIKTRTSYLPTQEIGVLTAYDKAANDAFGQSVAISGDGTRLAVGAGNKTISGNVGAGKVYIYVKTGSTWTLEAELVDSGIVANDVFGSSVSLNYSGNLLAIGVHGKDVGLTDCGKVVTYTRSGSIWTLETTITASDKVAGDFFGKSVAFTSDGTRLAVGAFGRDPSGITNAGQVYIYTRSGSTYTLEATITASDKAASDYFGTSASWSFDASRIAVGANNKTVGGTTVAGQVYIFNRVNSTYIQETIITASDKAVNDYFGTSVKLFKDGNKLAIGAFGKSVSGLASAGQVYVYVRSGTTWTLETTITASDKTPNNYFGSSLTLTDNSDIMIIGASNKSVSGLAVAGQAYIFS